MNSVSYIQCLYFKCNTTQAEVYLGFRGQAPALEGARGQQTGENLSGPSGTESRLDLHRG